MCKDCERLHEELKLQSTEMYGLRNRISTLEEKLREEFWEKHKLIKEVKQNKSRSKRKMKKGFVVFDEFNYPSI